MNHDISAMQYMRAHGNIPGPTQRPYLTGAVSGMLASAPSILVRYLSGALLSEADALGSNLWIAVAFDVSVLVLAGMIYAAIFKRAANDTRGGWMFGASFGFLIWMIGPVTIWQWTTGRALATGTPAMGIFGAQVIYGLALGGLFPFVNRALQTKMR
jgi:hypothetical protein